MTTETVAAGLAEAKNRLANDKVIGWIAENHGAAA